MRRSLRPPWRHAPDTTQPNRPADPNFWLRLSLTSATSVSLERDEATSTRGHSHADVASLNDDHRAADNSPSTSSPRPQCNTNARHRETTLTRYSSGHPPLALTDELDESGGHLRIAGRENF